MSSEERRLRAREEILIAEGSDWNWWYGPEHETANAVEFDQIYREHLANVYRALGIPTPPELSLPILKILREEAMTPPLGPISPNDQRRGRFVFRMAWRGGLPGGPAVGLDARKARSGAGGALRGQRDSKLFLRIDFAEDAASIEGLEIHAETPGTNGAAGAESEDS